MAYLIFFGNDHEIDRRDLTGPLVVGRAQESDVAIRDILLSRKHCRIEPTGEGWAVADLGSKNGTYVGNKPIARHQLKDGDEVRLGRTQMKFHAGPFEPAPPGMRRRDFVRPADPTEALAGTVAGFILVEPGEVERQEGAPVPQPRPPEPTAFASEDVYGMLNEIVSSSWDSIMAQASLQVVMERPLPRPNAYQRAPRVVSRPRVAFCLQAPEAEPSELAEPAVATPAETTKPAPPHRRWRRGTRNLADMHRKVMLGALSAVATTLLVGAWVLAVNQGPRTSRASSPPLPAVRKDVPPELADITFPN
jgi:predicted component of type VI protein secretion system